MKVTKKPVVHPHSRAAAKMTKQAHHDNRIERYNTISKLKYKSKIYMIEIWSIIKMH